MNLLFNFKSSLFSSKHAAVEAEASSGSCTSWCGHISDTVTPTWPGSGCHGRRCSREQPRGCAEAGPGSSRRQARSTARGGGHRWMLAGTTCPVVSLARAVAPWGLAVGSLESTSVLGARGLHRSSCCRTGGSRPLAGLLWARGRRGPSASVAALVGACSNELGLWPGLKSITVVTSI